MASWDEHTIYQSVIHRLLMPFISSSIILFLVGISQHWIVDNLVEERPINIFNNKKEKEVLSLIFNIVIVFIMFKIAGSKAAVWGLVGCILPDVLEGVKLLISKNPKLDWYKGKSQQFHLQLPIEPKINHKNNFKKDMNRRVITFCLFLFLFYFQI